MPVADKDLKKLITLELQDEDATVGEVIDTLWSLYSGWSVYDQVNPLYSMQYLQVRSHAIWVLMGRARRRITFSEPDRRQELREIFLNLKEMREETKAEISAAVISLAALSGAEISVDQMTVSFPNIYDAAMFPQPDDPRYYGVPYGPSLKDGWP